MRQLPIQIAASSTAATAIATITAGGSGSRTACGIGGSVSFMRIVWRRGAIHGGGIDGTAGTEGTDDGGGTAGGATDRPEASRGGGAGR